MFACGAPGSFAGTLLSWGEASFLQREKLSSQVAVGREEPAPLLLQTEPRWGAAEAELGDCIRIIESSPQHLLEGAGVWASERVTVLGCSRCRAHADVFLGCRLSKVRASKRACWVCQGCCGSKKARLTLEIKSPGLFPGLITTLS